MKESEWVKKGETRPEWNKVDHAVVIYGWGQTEDGIKYWNCQNSWGTKWGENGNFKMLRGDDSGGIESMGEAAMPYVVDLEDPVNSIQKSAFVKQYASSK